MKYQLSDTALAAVRNTSPNQVWAFVCSSARRDALIVNAHIALTLARAEARRIGGCVRMGHVSDGMAVTL